MISPFSQSFIKYHRNVWHCGGLSMVLLQLKDSFELFVKRREFLSDSGFLSRRYVTLERLGYPVSDIEIGLAYHLLCRSRSRCWNIVSKVGLCRRDKYLTMALGRGVVLTRPLPNKTPSVGMKQLKLKLLHNTYG